MLHARASCSTQAHGSRCTGHRNLFRFSTHTLSDMNQPITLLQLLESRDARHAMQTRLLGENPGKTLLCLTVVMPGNVKRNRVSLTVAHAALDAMCSEFGLNRGDIMERDLVTGFEAYALTDAETTEAKLQACLIEDTHPLGRLFDIDVINHDGVPVARQDVGRPPRRCLVCGREARYCMRARSHSQEEIWDKINNLVAAYLPGNDTFSQIAPPNI